MKRYCFIGKIRAEVTADSGVSTEFVTHDGSRFAGALWVRDIDPVLRIGDLSDLGPNVSEIDDRGNTVEANLVSEQKRRKNTYNHGHPS